MKRFVMFFLFFLAVRLVFIYAFPPYTDESLYARYGQIMVQGPHLAFASIGYWQKLPLPFWLFGLGSRLFGFVIGGRLVTLAFGALSFFAMYDLTRKIFGEEAALHASFIYAFCPLFIFYQSLALMDGIVLSLAVVILNILFRLYRTYSIKLIIALGIVLGFAVWIKLYSFLMVFMVGGAVFLMVSKKHSKQKAADTLLFLGGTVFLVFLPALLIPGIDGVIREPAHYTFPVPELLGFPWNAWKNNVIQTCYSLLVYLGPASFYFVFMRKKDLHNKYVLFFLFWFLIPVVFSVITGKLYLVRYVTYATVALVPLAAYAIKKTDFYRIISFGLVLYALFLLAFPLYFFGLFPKHPALARERTYLFEVNAAYSTERAVEVLDSLNTRNFVIGVPDIPGNPSDYVIGHYYYKTPPEVRFISTAQELLAIKQQANKPLLYMTRKSALKPELIPLMKLIKSYDEPGSSDGINVYIVE